MIPPTPTYFPTANPANLPFDPPSVSLWDIVPNGIQAWNTARNIVPLLQAAIILIIIIGGIGLIMYRIRRLREERVSE